MTAASTPALANIGTQASLAEKTSKDHPYIYVALYPDVSSDVQSLLKKDGITLSEESISPDALGGQGSIDIQGVAKLDKSNTVLMHLAAPEGGKGGYNLIVLASDEKMLSDGVQRLISEMSLAES